MVRKPTCSTYFPSITRHSLDASSQPPTPRLYAARRTLHAAGKKKAEMLDAPKGDDIGVAAFRFV
jgi:hypothetical protein